MKKLVLIAFLALASTQANALDLFQDLRDCTIDAANYTTLATIAAAVDSPDMWEQIVLAQAAKTKSEAQKNWVIKAGVIAWEFKGKSSPVAQGMEMYDACVKTIQHSTT